MSAHATRQLQSITQVLPSAFAVAGSRAFHDTLGLRERTGGAERVVLVLADGLGYDLLPRAARFAPLLAGVLDGSAGTVVELACTLPSTTPASLVSLGTGVPPGEHGVLGFSLNIPDTDRVLNHIRWRDDPDPAQWVPVPSVYARAGVASAVVLPAAFAGSGLTRSAYDGAQFVGLDDGNQVAAVRAALDRGARLVFTYISLIDTMAHDCGIASDEWATACRHTGQLLERLAAALPAGTALLVTADHGGLDVPADTRVDLGTDPRLSAGLRVVAGEPRLRHLHTLDGAAADVAAAWRELLGARAVVRTREEAAASGMFGPVRPEHLARIGDVVVTCTGDTVVLASGHEPPEVAELVGFHGAATHAETAIPLITLAPA